MPRVRDMVATEKGGWSKWIWIQKTGFRVICCTCGMAHENDYKVIKGKLYWRVRENKRSTAASRRKRKPKGKTR